MSENELINKILQVTNHGDSRLFRNNTGMGWVGGPVIRGSNQHAQVYPGDVLIRNARPLHTGLCKGGSDLIGIKKIIITPDMVDKIFGVLVAAEVKTGKAKATEEQRNFLRLINQFGGLADVVRSPLDATLLLNRHER